MDQETVDLLDSDPPSSKPQKTNICCFSKVVFNLLVMSFGFMILFASYSNKLLVFFHLPQFFFFFYCLVLLWFSFFSHCSSLNFSSFAVFFLNFSSAKFPTTLFFFLFLFSLFLLILVDTLQNYVTSLLG